MANLDLSAFDQVSQVEETKPKKSGLDISAFDAIELESTKIEEPSQMEAFIRSLAQGASLNTIDELTGAVKAPVGAAKATANILGADFSDEDVARYEKERDLSRMAYKAAEEAHPATYMAGEIAGSMAVPGLGIAKGGAGAAKGLAKFGTRALEGATLGGITGLGSTEETGTEALGQAGKGALLGGTVAPAVGALIDSIAPAAKWATGKITDTDVLTNAYQKAKAGQSLATDEAIYETNKRMLDFVRNELAPVVDTKTKKVVQSAYDDALAAARASGKSIRIEDLMDSVEKMAKSNRLGADDTKKVTDLIERFGEKQSVPTKTIMKKPNFINPEEAHLAEQTAKGDKFIQNQVDALKRTQDVKEARSMLKRAGEPSIVGNETPNIYEGIGPAFDSDLLAAKSQSASPTLKALKPYEAKPYVPKGESSSIDYLFEDVFTKPDLKIDDLVDLKSRLEVLAKSANPAEADAAAKMAQLVKQKSRELAGTDNYKMADELRKLQSEIESKFGDISEKAIMTKDRMAIDKAAKQLSQAARSKGKNRPEGAIFMDEGFEALGKILPEDASKLKSDMGQKALDVETATALGQGINPFNPKGIFSLEPAMVTAADISGKGAKKIHEWTDNQMADAIKYLYTSGKSTYAKMLERASMAPPEKKRALIFSLSQQPDFRNAFSDEDQK